MVEQHPPRIHCWVSVVFPQQEVSDNLLEQLLEEFSLLAVIVDDTHVAFLEIVVDSSLQHVLVPNSAGPLPREAFET